MSNVLHRDGRTASWVLVAGGVCAHRPVWGTKLGLRLCARDASAADRPLRTADVLARDVLTFLSHLASHYPIGRDPFVGVLQPDGIPERAARPHDAPVAVIPVSLLRADQHPKLGLLAYKLLKPFVWQPL